MVIVCHYRIYPVRMVCGHPIESEQRFVACDNHEGTGQYCEPLGQTVQIGITQKNEPCKENGKWERREEGRAGKGRTGREKARAVAVDTKVTGVGHMFKSQTPFHYKKSLGTLLLPRSTFYCFLGTISCWGSFLFCNLILPSLFSILFCTKVGPGKLYPGRGEYLRTGHLHQSNWGVSHAGASLFNLYSLPKAKVLVLLNRTLC